MQVPVRVAKKGSTASGPAGSHWFTGTTDTCSTVALTLPLSPLLFFFLWGPKMGQLSIKFNEVSFEWIKNTSSAHLRVSHGVGGDGEAGWGHVRAAVLT